MKVLLAIVLGLWLGDPAVAKPRTLLDTLLVPAPPTMNLVQGLAPGLTPEETMGTAAFDSGSNTLYYQGKLDKSTRAHETGHAFDHQILSDGDRSFFQKLMHAPSGAWQSGSGLQGGLASPSEWFADYYQASALGLDPRRENQAAYAQIGPKRLQRFEQALDRLGRRHNLLPYQ